jgi:hypothetical protein
VAHRRHHLDPGQQVVVDADPELGDRRDEAVGGGRLDVGDEDHGARRRRLVGLLHDPPHSLQLPQQGAEVAGALGVDR